MKQSRNGTQFLNYGGSGKDSFDISDGIVQIEILHLQLHSLLAIIRYFIPVLQFVLQIGNICPNRLCL